MTALATKRGKRKIATPAGELPADWGWDRIDNLGDVVGGIQKGPHRKAALNPTRYLTVAHVHANRLELEDVRFFEVTADELLRWKLLPDDLLIVEGNGSIEHVGRTALFRGVIGDCVHQNHVIRVRADAGRAFAPFLNAFLNSRRGRKIIQSVSSTSSGLRTLSVGKIRNLPVPVPPLSEQRKISDILGTWDDALNKLDALIAAKQQAKQGLMQQLLSGKRRLPGFKAKWVKSRLGLLAENVSVRNSGDLGWDRLYAVTKASGMIPMRAHVMGITTDRCKRVEKDWFAYNPMRLNIGSIARWSEANAVMVSPDYVVFRCKEGELSPRYFEHLRQADRWTQFVTGSGNGSVRVRLYFSDIARFDILKPPFGEQEAIAAVLGTFDDELRLLRARRDALDLQKQGLMERLLTGTLRVSP